MAIIGGVVAVVIVVLIIIVATQDDDKGTKSSTTTTAPLIIRSPATVTGITGVTGVTERGSNDSSNPAGTAEGSATTAAANTYPLVQTLVAPGAFDCTNLGMWQPFAEIQITFPVGVPEADATCGDNVLDLPAGSCAPTDCTEVPADWRVEEQDGVSPQALMVIVAPTDTTSTTGQFLCVKDFVPRPKQILPLDTPIEDACLGDTPNSVDLPYVPPPTGDIPYVPPPISVDLPPVTTAG
jgi:hypothetical protein